MKGFLLLAVILGVLSFSYAQSNNTIFARFINAYEEGVTVNVQPDLIPEVVLNYGEASEYQQLPNNKSMLAVFVNGTITGPLLPYSVATGEIAGYTTILIVKINNTLQLIPFNETEAASMIDNNWTPGGTQANPYPNRAWIRLLNVPPKPALINLYIQNATVPVFEHIGTLTATPFVEISPSIVYVTLAQEFTTAGNQTLGLEYEISHSTAYTILVIPSGNSFLTLLIEDRLVPYNSTGQVITEVTTYFTKITTGISTGLTSGLITSEAPATTVQAITSNTGMGAFTTGTTSTSEETSSTVVLSVTFSLVLLSTLLFFF